MFHFTCFNVEDPHDPSVGLMNGQLSIPGNLLRREVFDPVVNEVCLFLISIWLIFEKHKILQVLQLIEEQLSRVDQPVHALLLVGGFAGSEYLKQRVTVGISFCYGAPFHFLTSPLPFVGPILLSDSSHCPPT
jgi:hypothetical protein